MCNVLLTAAGRDSQNVPSVVIQHFDASRGHSVDAYGFCRLLKNENAEGKLSERMRTQGR